MQVLKAGILYFLLVFGAGFILGPVRILWLAPRVGTMWAELIEMPIMLVVVIFAARWTMRRLAVPVVAAKRMVAGSIALGLLLLSEFTVVLGLRGLSIGEYFATRDPVSGTAYLMMLGAFAVMPLFVSKNQ